MPDRVLILIIASKPFNLVIIHVYAPTSTCSDEDIEQFYNDLDCAHKKAGSHGQLERNSILQVKSYPGADGGGDHVPIVATLRLKLRKLHTKKLANKLQVQLLSTDAYRNKYQQCINPELNDIDTIDQLEDRYDRFVGILSTSLQSI